MQSQSLKFEFGRFVSATAGLSVGVGVTVGAAFIMVAALLQMAGGV